MTVTAETIRCRKCGATGIKNFTRRVYALQEHPAVDAIACLMCGQWLKAEPVMSKMTRAVPVVVDRSLPTCQVAGCSNFISKHPGQNKSGLCTCCANKVSAWRARGEKGTPPFFVGVDGLIHKSADRRRRI